MRAMLSYQHAYHAGNPADVHKHALLAWMLDYMTAKDKPLTYVETHAGRALYDLGSAEAMKTGEARAGVARALAGGWFAPDHPYARALEAVRAGAGAAAYPGSPLIASTVLRPGDAMHLFELHPAEHVALRHAMAGSGARITQSDGLDGVLSLAPPEPRRGLVLIDPSWEVKGDYVDIPARMAALHRKWNVGVIALWYPILVDARHRFMLTALTRTFPDALRSEVAFPPVRPGHGMIGSGMFVVNPPFGAEAEAARLDELFAGRGQRTLG
jgi:23S rRNA (adenine2030-N6)-methyltransferase